MNGCHTCSGDGDLWGHLIVFAPFAFELLFFVVGWAVLKDDRRAAYMSIPCGFAIFLEGESRLCTVAKTLAIESISESPMLLLQSNCNHHADTLQMLRVEIPMFVVVAPFLARSSLQTFLVHALSVLTATARTQSAHRVRPSNQIQKVHMERYNNNSVRLMTLLC